MPQASPAELGALFFRERSLARHDLAIMVVGLEPDSGSEMEVSATLLEHRAVAADRLPAARRHAYAVPSDQPHHPSPGVGGAAREVARCRCDLRRAEGFEKIRAMLHPGSTRTWWTGGRPADRRATQKRKSRRIAPGLVRVALALLSTSGCAATAREAVHYSGSRHAPVVSPPQLLTAASLPLGYERLGRLSTNCQLWAPGSPVEREWLVDLDCTERRLRRVLREKAAAVGGQLLVNERCGSQGSAPNSTRDTSDSPQRLMCLADVARADAAARSREPLAGLGSPAQPPRLGVSPYEAESLDDPTGAAAWRIRVSYWPRLPEPRPGASADLGLRPAREVGELGELPPSHHALGTLHTECERDCSEAAMRASVRVAAGRLGASDVVGVRCVPQSTGWRCLGTLAAPRSER